MPNEDFCPPFSLGTGQFTLVRKGTELKHNNHQQHEPVACKKSIDSDQKKKGIVWLLFGSGMERRKIARVLNNQKRSSSGFLTKTLWNHTQKMEEAEDMLKGVTAKISDADGTIESLDW